MKKQKRAGVVRRKVYVPGWAHARLVCLKLDPIFSETPANYVLRNVLADAVAEGTLTPDYGERIDLEKLNAFSSRDRKDGEILTFAVPARMERKAAAFARGCGFTFGQLASFLLTWYCGTKCIAGRDGLNAGEGEEWKGRAA